MLVDGKVRRFEQGPARLNAGEHRLRVEVAGYEAHERVVELEHGEPLTLTITLNPQVAEPSSDAADRAPATPPPPPGEPVTDAEGSSDGSQVGPYVTMGAGGALLIAAAVTGYAGAAAEQELQDAGCESACDESLRGTLDDARSMQTATNILLGVGIAAVAGGAAWWWLGRDSGEREGGTVADIDCGPGYCGASLRRSF